MFVFLMQGLYRDALTRLPTGADRRQDVVISNQQEVRAVPLNSFRLYAMVLNSESCRRVNYLVFKLLNY